MLLQPPKPPLVLDVNEVARLLTVPADTVRNLHRTGQCPGVLVGRHLRWRLADVEQYVNNLEVRH